MGVFQGRTCFGDRVDVNDWFAVFSLCERRVFKLGRVGRRLGVAAVDVTECAWILDGRSRVATDLVGRVLGAHGGNFFEGDEYYCGVSRVAVFGFGVAVATGDRFSWAVR